MRGGQSGIMGNEMRDMGNKMRNYGKSNEELWEMK